MLTVNEYFDGKVKSIAFEGSRLPATVGVMLPGDYTFATSEREYMTVVDGELLVKLPGADDWKRFGTGDTFTVEARQSFDLKVAGATAYFCQYES
ncbi:MAG: pyrimidine/purine nucleoside phosphorylase [Halioglobus sp.]|nr:pyrimidine/purine nucleoside phosphorylase [Halioglobus sp.]